MKKRVLAVVMCALMAGSVFTGFKDAGDDKELVLFTWEGMFPQEVLDDFEKELRLFIQTSIQMKPCLRSFPWQRAATMIS